MNKFYSHKLSNGITLLGEELESVSSAAISILLPFGSASDPLGLEGSATVLAELMHKGAGNWDSKQLSEQFEAIGAHRSHAAGIEVTLYSCSLLAENLLQAIGLFGIMLRRPHLPGEELESVRQLALQELKSLEDEPSSKVMVELARQFYTFPYGRCQLGTVEGLTALNITALRHYYDEHFIPEHLVFGVAGKFDWKEVVNTVEQAFGSWSGTKNLLPAAGSRNLSSSHHIDRDTNQIQIALAYPSASLDSSDYYVAKVGVGVLSGGMAGRLFVEVREKRGLVYRVSASHSAAKGRAAVFCYAGTTPENAEETLQVVMRELRNLGNGITEDELQRSKADIKSRVIIQSELSSVRATAIVNDWWNLGRIRSVEEIKSGIDAVTAAGIKQHLEEFPVHPVTLAVLGPKKLELPQ